MPPWRDDPEYSVVLPGFSDTIRFVRMVVDLVSRQFIVKPLAADAQNSCRRGSVAADRLQRSLYAITFDQTDRR